MSDGVDVASSHRIYIYILSTRWLFLWSLLQIGLLGSYHWPSGRLVPPVFGGVEDLVGTTFYMISLCSTRL